MASDEMIGVLWPFGSVVIWYTVACSVVDCANAPVASNANKIPDTNAKCRRYLVHDPLPVRTLDVPRTERRAMRKRPNIVATHLTCIAPKSECLCAAKRAPYALVTTA